MLYDATAKKETVKISNTAAPGAALLQDNSDYQLFVNGKEQICVMQVRVRYLVKVFRCASISCTGDRLSDSSKLQIGNLSCLTIISPSV